MKAVTAILFSMVGYFNGHDKTIWVMVQGLVQTLLVRLPLAYYMSILSGLISFVPDVVSAIVVSITVLIFLFTVNVPMTLLLIVPIILNFCWKNSKGKNSKENKDSCVIQTNKKLQKKTYVIKVKGVKTKGASKYETITTKVK